MVAHDTDRPGVGQHCKRLPQAFVKPVGLNLVDHDPIDGPQYFELLVSHLTHNANRQAGPRERLTIDTLRSQPELDPGLTHLVLEHVPKRLDQLQVHSLREAADVVMGLDRMRGA